MGLKPIFDNGHGGVINGVYQTPGKRSPKWSRGILYEGMFNRWVVNRIIEKIQRYKYDFPFYHISPELTDVSLKTRSDRANRIMNKDKNTYVISIHANAGGGHGIEGYSTRGYTKSDDIVEKFLVNLENDLKDDMPMRFDLSDGDRDKEANYWILRKPIGPAILLELGFMDNILDYNELWNEKFLDKVVTSISNTIIDIYNNGV